MLRWCWVLWPALALQAAAATWSIEPAAEYSAQHGETSLLVWSNGRIAYERRARGEQVPPRIYSITKSLVSIGVFRDAKTGGLSLGQSPAAGPARGVPLADLLNQTSGLPSAHREFYSQGLQDKEPVLRDLRRGAGGGFVYGPSHWEVLAEEIPARRGTTLEGWLRRFVPGAGPAALARWRRDDRGRLFFSTGARMDARDLLPAAREVLRGMGRGGWPAQVRELLQTGTPANRMYALGFWLNRGATDPGAREVAVETALGRDQPASFWQNGCLSRVAPADLLAMIGTRGQRVYVVPSRDMVVIRQGEGRNFSDAEFLGRLFAP
jgi:CubicO group peptidase (beta-lactamase class C family)